MANMAILGACSGIAFEVARIWAMSGHHLLLVARDPQRLAEVEKDLTVRGAKISILIQDLAASDAGEHIITSLTKMGGSCEALLYAAGSFQGNDYRLENLEDAFQEIENNYLSVVRILMPVASYFISQRFGTIAVIASVAGDRGRKSTLIYGSAKAGTHAFVDGLRGFLRLHGVRVVLIKPGPTDTAMSKKTPSRPPLLATPHRVAKDIVSGIAQKKCQIYTPWFWQPIMFILKLVPNGIWDRLKI